MAPKGNQSSTHRLLEIIRGGRDASGDAKAGEAGKPAPEPAKGKAAPRAKPRLAAKGKGRTKARHCVGVDIGPFGLSMVKTMVDNGGRQTLQGYWQTPYDDPNISFDSPEFARFLRSKLGEFLGSAKKAEIWALVSSAKAELWHMLVPRVSRGKLAETVYWAARKEKRFDEKEFVLDFENQGEIMDKGVPKLRIMAYLVPREAIEKRRRLFEAAGFKLAGITISPIALQTIFRSGWIPDAAQVSANVFVGRNWSRMDVYSQGNLILSRTMKAGVFSMIEALQIEYNERAEERFKAAHEARLQQADPDDDGELEVTLEFEPMAEDGEHGSSDTHGEPVEVDLGDVAPMEMDVDMDMEALSVPSIAEDDATVPKAAEDAAENKDFVLEDAGEAVPPETAPEAIPEEPEAPTQMDFDQAKRLLYHKLLDRPLGSDETGSELEAQEVFNMIRPAVERLVRQLERTFEHTANELGSESVEMIFFSGDICTNEMLIDFVRSQIGLKASLLDPMDPALPGLANIQVPDSTADRLTYNLTIGLALCSDETAPNLLNTFQQRDQTLRAAALNRNLAVAFLAVVVALSGVLFWQQSTLDDKQDELAELQSKVEAYQPRLDIPAIMLEAGKAKKRLSSLGDLSRRYEALAVAREITRLTPADVRLLSLNLNLGTGPVNGHDKDKADTKKRAKALVEAPSKVLIVDGVITGQRRNFDAALATYLVRLQDSPLFTTPTVHSREVEPLGGLGETLHFVLHINLPS